MSLEELRFGWLVVALLLGTVLVPAFSLTWLALAAVPWLAGATVLWWRGLGTSTAEGLAALGSSPVVRGAFLMLAGIGFLAACVFTPAAALYLFLWAGAAILLLASAGRSRLLQDLIVGSAVASVTTALALGGAEALLRTPRLASRLGPPHERFTAWNERYDRLWEHNILRFRSRHESIVRRPGVERIFVVGDSYTFGDLIADTDSTWPARLERRLGEVYPGHNFEVINSAHVGYTTANEAEMLRRLGWQFNPDLVVVQFYTNDALPSRPNLKHEGDVLFDPRIRLLPRRFRSEVVESSALLFLLEQKVANLTDPAGARAAFLRSFEEGSPGWEQMRAALREIGDSSQARGIPVVFMMFPTFFKGEHTAATYPFRSVVDKVSNAAAQAGLDVLDLTPVFAAEGGDWGRWWATPYDAHPSSDAHAVAARALARHLEQRGWPRPNSVPTAQLEISRPTAFQP